jgi:anaerobic selenocysteine-containing dehydrogenase
MVPATVEDVYELVFRRLTGSEGSVGFDLESADFVLSFGTGLLEGWGSPVRMFQANSQRIRKGGRLVQVDTRMSNTAAKADRWLVIQPGTQVLLAMGLLNVILSEGLQDRAYVDYQFNDFQALQDHVAPFTPGTVAERTGVEESDIISLAREFARAGRPLAVCGRGNGRTAEATAEVVAVQLLNAVVGGFARAGGVWPVPLPETTTWPEPVMDGKAEEGVAKPRVDGAGTNEFPYTMSLINRLPGAILSGKTYAVEALLIAGTNPAYSIPHTPNRNPSVSDRRWRRFHSWSTFLPLWTKRLQCPITSFPTTSIWSATTTWFPQPASRPPISVWCSRRSIRSPILGNWAT